MDEMTPDEMYESLMNHINRLAEDLDYMTHTTERRIEALEREVQDLSRDIEDTNNIVEAMGYDIADLRRDV